MPIKILLLNADTGPDYLADLICYHFFSNENLNQVFTNHIPQYLFEGYSTRHAIYGRGFTVYRKLPDVRLKQIALEDKSEIRRKISIKYYSFILFTSIHRFQDLYHYAAGFYSGNRLIAIDGEDNTQLYANADINSTYYKRELLQYREPLFAKSISFSIPSAVFSKLRVLGCRSMRTNILAPCDPRFTDSYIYNQEEAYYQQYLTSLFACTTKKGGWDCMRHYEIIACGAVPYFPGIDDKPPTTMADYPTEVQKYANILFESIIQSKAPISARKIMLISRIREVFYRWMESKATTQIYSKLIRAS